MSNLLETPPSELLVAHGEGSHKTEWCAAIEYQRGKPFSVMTWLRTDYTREPWWPNRRDQSCPVGNGAQNYDFEWCRTNGQLYWHLSGFGGDPTEFMVSGFSKPSPPPAKLWLAPGVRAVEYVAKTRTTRPLTDRQLLARGYLRIARPLALTRLLDEFARKRGEATRNPFDVADGDRECVYCRHCDDYLPGTDETWVCDHVRWCDDCLGYVYEDDKGAHTSIDRPDGKPVTHPEEED